MAIIEELGLERLVKRIDEVRDRHGLARAVKVVNRWGDDCFRCRTCHGNLETRYYSEKEYRNHVQMCKSVYRGLQDKNRQNSKKMRRVVEKLDAIYEQTTHLNYLYFHQNRSLASGIGEFASNCTSFLGYGILGLLEGGLIPYKMDCIYSLFRFLRWNPNVAQTLLENPDCRFLSSINDILLFHNSKSRYHSTGSELLLLLSILLRSAVMSSISHLNFYPGGSHLLHFNIKIFKQLLAIARQLLALSNNAHPESLTYHNLIIIPILWGCTNTLGKEVETDFRQKLYNTRKRTFDFNKVTHDFDLVSLVYGEKYYTTSYFFPARQKRDSPLDFGWQTYLRREIALQLFRTHVGRIYEPHEYHEPNFGIMSYISPYLISVDSDEEEIGNGLCNLTLKFLSVTKKHISDHEFQVDVFRDIFEAVSILERFNCDTEIWDSAISQWLTKNHPYYRSHTDTIQLTQNYWRSLQGFRKLSLVEAFSQRCRAILNKPLVLKHLAEWLDISSLETYELAWEDMDPYYDWEIGFWHAPSPPKGIEIKYLEYCSRHRQWRIIKEEYRFGVELEKLYGYRHLIRRSRLWDRWYYSDVLESDDHCPCDDFDHIKDWQIYLQWEEREIIIKDMIKENLRKTRPDIMNGDDIVAQRALHSSTQGASTSDAAEDEIIHAPEESQSQSFAPDSASVVIQSMLDSSTQDTTSTPDADIDTAKDEFIHASEVSEIQSCSPDSSSDIYPSYDLAFIHQ